MNKQQKQAKRALERQALSFEKEMIRNYQVALKEIRGKLALVDEKHGLKWYELQKYDRLVKLEEEIGKEIGKLTGRNAQLLLKAQRHAYEESYYRTAHVLSTQVNANIGFVALDSDKVKRAINNPLDRVGMLQRNRDNQRILTRQMKEQLTQGIIQGESYRTTAKRLKERMDVGASKALTIARTENHRVIQGGKQDAREEAVDLGVNLRKQWISAGGERTREAHAEADGQTVDYDEPFDIDGEELMYPGDESGSAENVINCRCDVIELVDGFVPSSKAVTGKQDYEQFKKNL